MECSGFVILFYIFALSIFAGYQVISRVPSFFIRRLWLLLMPFQAFPSWPH